MVVRPIRIATSILSGLILAAALALGFIVLSPLMICGPASGADEAPPCPYSQQQQGAEQAQRSVVLLEQAQPEESTSRESITVSIMEDLELQRQRERDKRMERWLFQQRMIASRQALEHTCLVDAKPGERYMIWAEFHLGDDGEVRALRFQRRDERLSEATYRCLREELSRARFSVKNHKRIVFPLMFQG